MPVQHTGEGMGGEGLVEFAQQVHANVVRDRLPVRAAAHVMRGDTAFPDEDGLAEAAGLRGEQGHFYGGEVAIEMLGDGFRRGFAAVEVEVHKVEARIQQRQRPGGEARVFRLIL